LRTAARRKIRKKWTFPRETGQKILRVGVNRGGAGKRID
jgi:hypothetical protein